MFYNGNKILSFNNTFNFCIGQRSVGKSFYFKKWLIHKYLKYKKRFINVYRYDTDIENKANKYFDNVVNNLYPDFKMILSKNTYLLINTKTNKEEVCGYVQAVNKMARMNSTDFSDVGNILFDEFITLDNTFIGGKSQPLKEPELFINFYQTVARGFKQTSRDVNTIFIANTVTLSNPYFIYFGIDKILRLGEKYVNLKNKNISIEFTQSEEITKEIEKTKFFKTIKNTKYADFAICNDFYLDNDNFVKKENPKNKKPLIRFICDNREYILYQTNKYFLFSDKKTNEKVIETISVTDKDFRPNYKKILSFKKSNIYKNITSLYEENQLYFTSQTSYKIFLFIFSIA